MKGWPKGRARREGCRGVDETAAALGKGVCPTETVMEEVSSGIV